MPRNLTAPPRVTQDLLLYGQALEYFSIMEKESAHNCIFLVNDPMCQRVLAGFTTLGVSEWEIPYACPTGSDTLTSGKVLPASLEERLWEWMWEGVTVDFEKLSIRVDLERSDVEQKFEVLRSARLIRPDGRAIKMAMGVLRSAVGRVIGSKKKA